ncbi:hypothetical protein Ancab_015109 [Ancistrocladus abbreviatus]
MADFFRVFSGNVGLYVDGAPYGAVGSTMGFCGFALVVRLWVGLEVSYTTRSARKNQCRQKDDVLYGVFASVSSDSDDDGSSSKKRLKDVIKKADFTEPVNFLSAGTVTPNQEIDRNSKEEKHLKDEDDDNAGEYRPGSGLEAASTSGSGLGFVSSSNRQSRGQSEKKSGAVEEEEDDEDSFLPTAFGRKIQKGAEQRQERSKLAANSKSQLEAL